MATIVSKVYKRPISANDKYSFGKICVGARIENVHPVTDPAPALASVLPASQAYVPVDDFGENVICGGTTKLIGKMVGILMTDTVESTNAAYVLNGGPFRMKAAADQTWATGKEVWWKTTDGLVYSADPGGGTGVECGYVVTDPEGNDTVVDPANLPTSTYVFVVLNQIVS